MNYKNLDTSKLNYVVYCRKSSEGEDRQIQSLDTQLRELKEHAERNNLNIVETISESKSAFKIGREGFGRMMKLIDTGKADAILVIRANRISRNSMDAGYAISLMDEKKLLYIRTPHSTCYTSSSTDKMMIALELIFSKKDSDDKGDMVKEGQRTKALKGIPHGAATLGFLNDKTEEKGNRKWYVDEPRLKKIKILFDMFLTGTYSAGKLHAYAVNELKLTTVQRKKTGGALITLSRIYEILKDPIYAGFFYQAGERFELDRSLPSIITEDQHKQIKIILANKNIPKVQHHETIYAGFITSEEGDFMGQDVKYQLICDCKHKFAYRSKTHCPSCNKEISKLSNPKYLGYTHYYNVRKKKSSLPYKTISEAKVSEQLNQFIDENLNFSEDLASWSKKYIHALKDKEISEKVLITKDKEERKAKLVKEKAGAREMLRKGHITPEEYKEDLEAINKANIDLDTPVEKIDWYSEMIGIVDLTQEFKNILASGTLQAKRKILALLGSNLVWDEEKLSIYNKKSISTLIKGMGLIRSTYPEFEPKNYVVPQGSKEKTEPKDPVFSMMLGR